jgi:putative aldouronate transport system substrate-binding protein
MKKKVLSVLLACAMTISLAACGNSADTAAPAPADTASETKTEEAAPAEEAVEESGALAELVDGKFADTRHITVEVYDRNNDGGTDPTNNMYTDYIKKGMLEKYNVEVEFVAVPRWTEVEEINNLLAGGTAPDICVTYSYPTVLTYANMGGIVDLKDYAEEFKSVTPNLWDFLGEEGIFWDKDPKTGSLWAIEGRRVETQKSVTFVRQDWLDKLGLKAPTTTDEFHDMLVAFKDNASELLGADASKMVPFSISYDVGWRATNLIASFQDPKMTDKERYVNGFDDRYVTQNGTKEAVQLLNKWYNEGLLWKDFPLYPSGDSTEDDMIKAGYVGCFEHNWDYVFRNGEDSINSNLRRNVGEDAKFVAIDPFEDKNGGHSKWMYSAFGTDRKIFFPSTNDEPLASFLYLDFISSPEVLKYLQAGDEGVTHEVLESGAIQLIAATGDPIQNSGKNIDYTLTCNGTWYGDEKTAALSLAYGYGDQEPDLVDGASKAAQAEGMYPKNVNVGEIAAEAEVGDTLTAKRDEMFDNAVVASEADFDSVWDSYMADYLSAGGQAIMDERAEKWAEYFGDSDMLP